MRVAAPASPWPWCPKGPDRDGQCLSRLVTAPWARRRTARRRAGTARARSLPRRHLGPIQSRDRDDAVLCRARAAGDEKGHASPPEGCLSRSRPGGAEVPPEAESCQRPPREAMRRGQRRQVSSGPAERASIAAVAGVSTRLVTRRPRRSDGLSQDARSLAPQHPREASAGRVFPCPERWF